MALRDDSLSIDDPRLLAEDKLAVVLGTEGDGLAAATIAHCDYTVRIPMAHGVDSLNVAAASAVAFYQLGKKCALCDGEIYRGEKYYHINGQAVCRDCLAEYAVQVFAPYLVKGG